MTKNKKNPIVTVALMMGATVLSKALGMIRSMVMARKYDIGIEAQAFSEASHIPLTLFDLAFGAAILGCFIPVYNSIKNDDGENDSFANTFLNFILLAASLLSIIGVLCADGIIDLMAPALDGEVKLLAAKLLRIMFPMIIFTGSTFTLVGVMQSKGRFLLPAMVSAISNAGVIIYLIFIDGHLGEKGIYGLAVAYLVSWFLQLVTLAIPLTSSGFRYRPKIDWRSEHLKIALKMAPPIMLGSWLTPISVLCGLYFAPFTKIDGAVTIFDYGLAAFTIISGILTYSICNYAFPMLSKADGKEWSNIVRTGFNAASAIILPFTVAAILLSREITAVLYLGGSFGADAADKTANVLRCMLIGMPAFSVIELSSRTFYSKKNVKIPMFASITGIAVNIIASAILVKIPSLSVGSVGLGYALGLYAAALVMIVSMFVLHRDVFKKSLWINLLKLVVSTVISSAVWIVLSRFFSLAPFDASPIRNIINALIIFLPGAVIYLVLLKLFKVKFKTELSD